MTKINTEYDIGKAFEAIEDELIASMIRNMERHKLEEITEDKQWTMWQTEQLQALEKYRKDNQKRFGEKFKEINSRIETLIRTAKDDGNMDQEAAILDAIRRGFPAGRVSPGASAAFFRLNQRKLEALIKATTSDMEKVETAVLRMANDRYRKVIFNAQVYANSGAGTYEKAVDMATKDYLAAGLNCIEYANGARHTLADYADMAIRTASKRAYLQGEGQKRQEWGITTVIMNKRGNPCPKCLPFVGKVLIDDVWSGGSAKDGPYPLMSAAITAGLYHPRCRDSHTTYFPELENPDNGYSKKDIEDIEEQNRQEARQQYAERQEKKYGRLAKYSLDEENRARYQAKREEWKGELSQTVSTNDLAAKEVVLGAPENITSTWTAGDGKTGNVSELQEYIVGENKYKVDGKRIFLDYSAEEREVAESIAKMYGKKVQMVPKVTYPQGISTPDFIIDDVEWDLKTISTGGKNVFYNAVKKKKRQARCFIFDVTNCPLQDDEIQKQIHDLFRSTHLTFIDQVGIYKDKQIISVYKRGKK